MKKTLPILSIVVLLAGLLITFTACQSEKKPDSLTLSATDTTGLAQFQSWKANNEEMKANLSYVQGFKDAMATNAATTATAARPKVVYKTPVKPKSATPQPAPQPAKKKGWSKAAKGTVIGTATGATAGALILKKNRVLGGIIGGVVGGGIGYGIGRGMDKKDGRY